MADVIVSEPDTPDEHDREMGRTEGIAEVHAEQAGAEAQNAETAALAAQNAVDINAALAETSSEAAAEAQDAAETSVAGAAAVVAAIEAQTATLQSLMAKLEERDQQAAAPVTPSEPKKTTPAKDTVPTRKPRFRDRYNKT